MKTYKQFCKNFMAMCIGLFVALVLTEILTRVILPIFPGNKTMSIDGKIIQLESKVQHGITYRQISEEYDALTTITNKGYRIPEATSNPRIVFIGDSFTFGQGLKDQDTFPWIFCQKVQLLNSCANLGVPGASTIAELDRLESYLNNEKWRPGHVFLFFLGMTQFLGGGNDLYDNYIHTQESKHSIPANLNKKSPALQTKNTELFQINKTENAFSFLKLQATALRYSNLIRVLKYYFGPLLKSYFSPASKKETLGKSLAITKIQFSRLHKMSKKYNFRYQIIVLHPVQDIIRGSHDETISKLQAISQSQIHPTAQIFQPMPEKYYFPLDGHFNPKGSMRLAEFLNKKFSNIH